MPSIRAANSHIILFWCGYRDIDYAHFSSRARSELLRALVAIKPALGAFGFSSQFPINRKSRAWGLDTFYGAGTGTQTRGLFLGKEALYQLSYTRVVAVIIFFVFIVDQRAMK